MSHIMPPKTLVVPHLMELEGTKYRLYQWNIVLSLPWGIKVLHRVIITGSL